MFVKKKEKRKFNSRFQIPLCIDMPQSKVSRYIKCIELYKIDE